MKRRPGMSFSDTAMALGVVAFASAAVVGTATEYGHFQQDVSSARILRQTAVAARDYVSAHEVAIVSHPSANSSIIVPVAGTSSSGSASSGSGSNSSLPPISISGMLSSSGSGQGGSSQGRPLTTATGHRPEVAIRVNSGSRQAHVAVVMRDGAPLSERRARRIARRAHPDAAVVMQSGGQLVAQFVDGRLRPLGEVMPNASSVSPAEIVGRVIVPVAVPLRSAVSEGIHRPNLGVANTARSSDNVIMGVGTSRHDVQGASRATAQTVNTGVLGLNEVAVPGAPCTEARRLARTSGTPPILLVCHGGVWVAQRSGV